MTIPILATTHESFVNQVFSQLGKGRVHASLIYEEFFRSGQIQGKDGAFNNAKALLKEIQGLIDFSMPTLIENKHDGMTGKFLLKTSDNLEIESVLIPMQAGGTLCISSQVGCRMGCSFCETGRMGLLRNLTTQEIISQVFIARYVLKFEIRNIVFMGMGEPFDNYDHVMQAVRILNDSKGLGFGRSHLTISTSGCVDGIYKMIQEGSYAPNLAVSINASNDELRNRLMPVNRKHNMAELYQSLKDYCEQTKKQILIAYVLMKDQNDTLKHAVELSDYLEGLDVKINLIPYNPQSRDRYQPPELPTLEAFTEALRQRGYCTLLRLTKGTKIMAACGQLGNLELRKKLRVIHSSDTKREE